jgi:hypothetical protein
VHRSTSFVRRACAVGTATALIGLTTGFGVMTATTAYADDAPTGTSSTSAPVAGADAAQTGTTTPGSDATAPSGDVTTPAAPSLPSDGATSAPGTTTGGDAAGTGATSPTAPTTGTASPAPTRPTTSKPSATSPAEAAPTAPAPAAAATAAVTISGSAKVGQTLRAKPEGFTDPSALSYSWSVAGVPTGDQGPTYDVVAADAGAVVSVTVTNTLTGHTDETATAETAAVTQDPAFVDADGKPVVGGTVADEDSLPLEATAGEPFSYTFHTVGTPAPALSLDWYYGDDQGDVDEPEYTPESQLPDGITFDPATGVLSGTADEAFPYYDFAVTATNDAGSVTEYLELSVAAGAPAGVEVFAADRKQFTDFLDSDTGFGIGFGSDAEYGWSAASKADSDDSTHDGSIRSWIIDGKGAITTIDTTYHSDDDGSELTEEYRNGGTPTVPQGGTLITNGGLVDRFGNDVTDADEMPLPVSLRSDTASDVITADPLFGDYGNFTDVTFTEASTHTLTATGDAFSTSFPVVVTPTATTPGTTPPVSAPPVLTPPVAAAPIGTVPVRTAAHGRLAYTGSDATDSLPWALGMLAAGAALVGLRIVRRRAQR